MTFTFLVGWACSRTSNTTGNNSTALGTGAGLSLTAGDNVIDTCNGGVTGEASAIRIGKARTQSARFIAAISGLLPLVEQRLFEIARLLSCLVLVHHEVAAYFFSKLVPERAARKWK